jgi:hypothetical protein
MQSPAPRKQKIAGRSDLSKDTKEEEAFDIIENIEAITVEREIEDKNPPETDGGSVIEQ